MVQFIFQHGEWSRRGHSDWVRKNYWKMNPTDIQDIAEWDARVKSIVKAKFRSDLDPNELHYDDDDLQHMRTRLYRGMILYHGCTIDELRRFCKDRGISAWILKVSVKPRTHVALGMIDALEQADEDFVFDKFLDLPPELRVLIYEYSFESLEPVHDRILPPPPIAQVSRLLRKESLPPFYQITGTQLNISTDHCLKKELRVINAGPIELLELINTIKILDPVRSAGFTHIITITADGAKTTPQPDDLLRPEDREALAVRQAQLDAMFKYVFQECSGKAGSLNLKRGDGKSLWKFFNDPQVFLYRRSHGQLTIVP